MVDELQVNSQSNIRVINERIGQRCQTPQPQAT